MITGASKGLGSAIAEQLAGPQTRLFLWARDKNALKKIRENCQAKGAEVFLTAFDLTNITMIADHLQKTDQTWPLEHVYINAGIFDGARAPGALEVLSSEMAIIDVNLKAAIAVAHAAAVSMRPRKRGQIIFISSLAGRFPLADAPAYSASKAGISAYASALREKLLNDRILVSDIRPGHISTSMTKGHTGVLPMVVSPEKAAAIIVRKVAEGHAVIDFPKPLSWLITFSVLLPWRLRAFFGRTQRFHIKD